MILSSSRVDIYSSNVDDREWVGAIISAGVPHFNGSAVNYLLENGELESAVYVGV